MQALAGSPILADVQILGLYGNPIGDEGALALARSPYLGRLRSLNLINTHVGEAARQTLRERFPGRQRDLNWSPPPASRPCSAWLFPEPHPQEVIRSDSLEELDVVPGSKRPDRFPVPVRDIVHFQEKVGEAPRNDGQQ